MARREPGCFLPAREGLTKPPRDDPDLTLSLPDTLFTFSIGCKSGEWGTGDSCLLRPIGLVTMFKAVSLLFLFFRLLRDERPLLNVGLGALAEQSSMAGGALSPRLGPTKLMPLEKLQSPSFFCSSDQCLWCGLFCSDLNKI